MSKELIFDMILGISTGFKIFFVACSFYSIVYVADHIVKSVRYTDIIGYIIGASLFIGFTALIFNDGLIQVPKYTISKVLGMLSIILALIAWIQFICMSKE